MASPPFSLQDDALGARPKGIDPESLLAKALKGAGLARSEYETNADHAARVARALQAALPGDIAAGGRFAVIQGLHAFPPLWRGGNPSVESRYSAETETLTVKLDRWITCFPLKRTVKPKREYTAANGFGHKVTVIEIDEHETCIEPQDEGAVTIDDLAFRVPIPRKDAPRVANTLSVVIIGRLAAPHASEDREHERPRLSHPIEVNRTRRSLVMRVDDVWLVDTHTGKVLAKHRSPFRNADPALAESPGITGTCSYPDYAKSELPDFDRVVELAFVVRADGSVAEGSVRTSTGIDALDRKAMQAIARCRFRPATRDGVAVDGTAIVKFHFDRDRAKGG